MGGEEECRQGMEAQVYLLLAEEKIYHWVPGFKLEEVTETEYLDSASSPFHLPLPWQATYTFLSLQDNYRMVVEESAGTFVSLFTQSNSISLPPFHLFSVRDTEFRLQNKLLPLWLRTLY